MKAISAQTRGFTLIELIVVMTIIAILAAIGFVAYSNYIKSARDTDRVTAVKEIAIAVDTFDPTGLKPVRLWLLKDFKKYPTDPTNNLWYQYNVNSAGKSGTNKNLWGKWFMICTNRPLEKNSDDDGNVKTDFMDVLDISKDRSKFINGKLQDKNGTKYEDVTLNKVMGYYCEGVTTDFASLVAGGGSNSIGTQTCSSDILNPTKEEKERGAACKVVFNMSYDNQAPGASPSAGTPPALPTQ